MVKTSFRRLSKKKLLLTFWTILVLSYLFYAEYLIYKLKSNSWPSMSCKNEETCTRILLVADPQIIGNLNEPIRILTPFTIFDSDRYLKITYYYAFHFIKPHVVVFLGDLMDEAHIASNDHFQGYVRRVYSIFLRPFSEYQHVKHIWLPGDNDIGGEDTDVTPKKLQRFERAFSQPSLINHQNITFFKINRLADIIPVYKKEREFFDTSRIFIGLSHVPLMFRPSVFTEKVINKMMPHVLFTAHEHKSMIISTDALLRKDNHITPIIPDHDEIYEYSLGIQNMYEILIPTCSYRMGTNRIGYGYAIIENNELSFTILWSPSRFKRLALYLPLVVLPLLVFFLFKCFGCARNFMKKIYGMRI
ncbi:metallophosphoesterase 1 [Euwallacea similis]|uniref:metallophosphoesterase 1 n=1 Tax=Euwallacea similis TaxID=1736056 RepID=UPI003450BF10